MEKVLMMDCDDGYRRADIGALGKRKVIKTAAYTILPTETGTRFSNSGAGAAVTLTLPVPKGGEWFMFLKETIAQDLIVKAPAGVKINGGTAGEVYKNTQTTVTATLTLVAAGAADYFVQAEKGTWANAAS